MSRLTILTNSPGEATTFVRPVLEELEKRKSFERVEVNLVPCPFASGAEKRYFTDRWPGLKVRSPWETTLSYLRREGKDEAGVIAFLGGESWHAVLLKKLVRKPVVGYFHRPPTITEENLLSHFDATASSYSPRASDYIGDLRVDAVHNRLSQINLEVPRSPTLTIFPGSRAIHLRTTLLCYLKVAECIQEKIPDLKVKLAVSPFVDLPGLRTAANNPLRFGFPTTTVLSIQEQMLLTDKGMRVDLLWGEPYRAIAGTTVALSVPGSNVAELAIAGKAVVIPLSMKVPVGGGGLVGVIERLGLLPRTFQSRFSAKRLARARFTAIPNQLAGEEIVPEIFVDKGFDRLHAELLKLFQDPNYRERLQMRASNVFGEQGAASRFVSVLEKTVGF